MSTNSTHAPKVWIWDGKLREIGESGWRESEADAAAAIGMGDAIVVAAGDPPCRRDHPAMSGEANLGGVADGEGPGSGERLDSGAWRLLAPEAAGALRDSDAIYRRWKRAGMLRGSDEEAWGRMTLREKMSDAFQDGWRVYSVSVFHLEPVAVRRIRSSGERNLRHPGFLPNLRQAAECGELSKDGDLYEGTEGARLASLLVSDPLLRRVVRMAVRAVYTLGFDLGDAVVALHGSGRAAALSVRQPEAWTVDGVSAAWDEAMQRFETWYAAERDRAAHASGRQVLIGADPEFVLLRENGRIAPADRYFGIGGGAGADALLVGRQIVYPIAEVRPDPAASPEGLADSVRRQLMRAATRVGDGSLRWASGAMPVAGVALGGHIHVSGAALTSRLLRQLDRYVALPAAMVESDNGRGRRPRYGALGDYREQSHGGFEYRTLPSWLASPLTAKAAFALTLLCAKDTWALPVRPLLSDNEEAAFYEGDRTELRGCLDEIAGELAGAPSYNEYARWIEPLFEAARRGAVWDESVDIRRKWRIGPYAPQ